LAAIGLKSTIEKTITMKGSKVAVEVSVHKATTKKEMAL